MVQFGYDGDGENVIPVPRTPSPRKSPQGRMSSTGKAEALRAAQLSALASRTPSPMKALKLLVEDATTAQLEAAMHRLLQINDAIRSVPFMTSEESQAYLAQQRARVQEFERQKTRRQSAAQQYLKRLTEEVVNDEARLAEARKALESERAKKEKEEKERAEARAKAEAEQKRKQEEAQKARDAQAKALADAQNAKKAQEEQKKAAEKQKQEATEKQKQQQQAAAPAAATSAAGPAAQGSVPATGAPNADACPPEAWKTAEPLLARLKTIKNEVRPKAHQPAFHDAFMQARMAIKTRIGQQTMSQAKIITIAKHVSQSLEQGKAASPEVYETLMDFTAKCIVAQAEREVAVKTSQAYPLALISVMLFTKHEPFLDMLLGRLYKKCPYLIPQYFKKVQGETPDQEKKRVGMKQIDDDWETEEHFWERMGGMVALYAGIVQTVSVPHKYGLENGWTWLARILNMKPRRITAVLIYQFLEIAAFQLQQTFSNQMRKLMQYIYEQYIPRMKEMKNGPKPSIIRLESFIHDNYLQKGRFDEPAGHKLEA